MTIFIENTNLLLKYNHSVLIRIVLRMLQNMDKTNNSIIANFLTQRKNVFFSDQIRDELTDTFRRIQNVYWTLNKFARGYKYKKSKILITDDLCMNELILGAPNVMCIYQHNTRYLFSVSDIIKIINTSLTHSDSFFSTPVTIKNPYNNSPFDKSTLYNIYFFVKFKTRLYPELLIKFFHCNFNIARFSKKYESLLRNYAIEQYVNNSDVNLLCIDIRNMMKNLNVYMKSGARIIVNADFPQKTLLKIMRPYLLLWYTSCYSLIVIDADNAAKTLLTKYRRFSRLYPKFGRKIAHHTFIYTNYGRRNCITYTFNEEHPTFITHTNFLSSHVVE